MSLEFIETNALLDELMKRFDCAVFCGELHMSDVQTRSLGRYVGNRFVGAGMCSLMIHRLMQEYEDTAEIIEDMPSDE